MGGANFLIGLYTCRRKSWGKDEVGATTKNSLWNERWKLADSFDSKETKPRWTKATEDEGTNALPYIRFVLLRSILSVRGSQLDLRSRRFPSISAYRFTQLTPARPPRRKTRESNIGEDRESSRFNYNRSALFFPAGLSRYDPYRGCYILWRGCRGIINGVGKQVLLR